jgi:hypothetical protein
VAEHRAAVVAVLATAAVTVPLTAAVTWRVATARPAPLTASPPPPPAPEAPKLATPSAAPALSRADISAWASGFELVAAADIDGDGTSEIAGVGPEGLRVFSSEGKPLGDFPAPGGPQVLAGIDGVFYAGWGRTKAQPDAKATVTRHGLDASGLVTEVVAAPSTARAQIVAISATRAGLLLAWFADQYTVSAQRASRGAAGWTLDVPTTARTAPVWLAADLDGDGAEDLVLGRTYGDAPGSDGDAVLVRSSGERVPIATTRGVRAGCIADTDGDGHLEVVLADGWDKDYGRKARARLRIARWTGAGMDSTPIDESPGDYDVRRLLAADIDSDGKDEILAVTNTRLRVVERQGDGWVAWDAGKGVVDAAVLADGRIVTVGAGPELISREP